MQRPRRAADRQLRRFVFARLQLDAVPPPPSDAPSHPDSDSHANANAGVHALANAGSQPDPGSPHH